MTEVPARASRRHGRCAFSHTRDRAHALAVARAARGATLAAMRFRRTGRAASAAAGAALLFLAAALGVATRATAADPATAPALAPDPWSKDAVAARFPAPDAKAADEDFAGSSSCKDCHEDRWKSLGTSFHASLRNEKKSASRGCESCHGPSATHSESEAPSDTRHPGRVDAQKSVALCVTCHADVLVKPVLAHRDWLRGPRDATRTCVTCHTIHVDREAPAFDEKLGPFTSRKALAEVAKPVDAAQCATCHTTFHPEMARSGHAFLLKEGDQCAACHGNGSLHAQSGGDPRKIVRPDRLPVAEADAQCMDCHRSGDSVARWTCAEHSREKVACIVCHDANAPRGRTLRGREFDLCGGCHRDVQAKFRLPNGHRVERGRVSCSDCHDPHGNTSRVRDADLRLRVCEGCHAEKAGPFLFDHGIKRTEGCIACHDPHGSVNRRALTFARVRPLCLQCHPETPHDLSQRRYDNCIACHSEIHGSDLDRKLRR